MASKAMAQKIKSKKTGSSSNGLPFYKALTMKTSPIHSNIKVGTIVNIMKVNSEHLRKIEAKQIECEHYKAIGDSIGFLWAEIELKKEEKKYSEFLDFYI